MTTARRKKLIPKVTSLGELQRLGLADERYAELAVKAAQNLGASGDRATTFDGAMQWLRTNAQETSEVGVVDEVNFCRDLVVRVMRRLRR